MNQNNLNPETIHNLFLQQIQKLSIESHLQNTIKLRTIRGEV